MPQANFPVNANPLNEYTNDQVYWWQGHRYRELVTSGGPTESIAVDRGQASMKVALNWQDRIDFVPDVLGYTEVLRLDGQIAAARINEVQVVNLASGTASGGTFTLEYAGQVTGNIAYDATAATVQTALAGLPNIGMGNVSVTGAGGITAGFTVTFQNALGGQDVPRMVVDDALLTGASPVAQVTTTYEGGVDDTATRYLSRHVPMPYPPYRTNRQIGRYYMVAEGIQYQGDKIYTGVRQFGSAYQSEPQKLVNCAEAEGMISFSSRNYVIMDDQEMRNRQNDNAIYPDITGAYPAEYTLLRYVTGQYRPRAHYQTIPQFSVLLWNSDDRPVDNKSVAIIVEADVELTWHQVPVEAYPKTAINRLLGRTNRYPFGAREGPLYNLLGTFGPGTLVCLAPSTRQYRMANGEFAVDITYKFQYFPRGANTLLRVNFTNAQANPAIEWERASRDGASYIDETVTYVDLANGVNPVQGNEEALLYQPDNFDTLFQPEPG